jgi:hypothetical protein
VGLGLTAFTRGHFPAPLAVHLGQRFREECSHPADVTNHQRQQAEESKAWVTQIVLTRLTSLTQRQKKKARKVRNTSVLSTRQLGSLWSSNENTVTIREQLTNSQTFGDGKHYMVYSLIFLTVVVGGLVSIKLVVAVERTILSPCC